MSDTTTPTGSTQQRWRPLDPVQRRVLGVLIEKAKTTPASYPMTVNAIVTGCNQKSSRSPVMSVEAFDVEKALDELERMDAVTEIDWMGRVPKYKHKGYEWLGVNRAEMAVMTELLLRGDQALGELRARAARMEPISDLEALQPIVDALIARGLMVAVTPSGRGQIVTHALYLPNERATLNTRPGTPAPRPSHDTAAGAPRTQPPASGAGEDAGGLSQLVMVLRSEVASLRDRVQALEKRLDQDRG